MSFSLVIFLWFVVNQIDMVRGGPGSYKLKMNESSVEAEIHTLRDGGLLMQVSDLLSMQHAAYISCNTLLNVYFSKV